MDVQSERLTRVALRLWTAIGTGVLLVAAWMVLREPVGLIGPPVAIAFVLIYLLNPTVRALERRGVTRALGTLLAYVCLVGVLWAAVSLLGPLLVEQARGLLEELPGIGESLQSAVNDVLARLGVPPSSRVELDSDAVGENLQTFLTTNQEQLLGLLRGAQSVVSWVVHVGIAITLGPILAFYALADLPRLGAGARRLLPPSRRPEIVEVGSRIGRIVGAYFRGQLLVATFVGTATALGLAVIGLPFWAVVGVTTGVFNLVPLVGPTAGAVFGVTLALTVGDGVQQAVLVVVVMVVVQQIDNHLITPVIVARSVEVHPITVILALIVAGSLGGIPMMFVAIPAVAVLKLIVLHVLVTRFPSMAHVADHPEDGAEPARRGTVANLAQELRRSFERRLAEVGSLPRTRDEIQGARSLHPAGEDHGDTAIDAGREPRAEAEAARAAGGGTDTATGDGRGEVSRPAQAARPS